MKANIDEQGTTTTKKDNVDNLCELAESFLLSIIAELCGCGIPDAEAIIISLLIVLPLAYVSSRCGGV